MWYIVCTHHVVNTLYTSQSNHVYSLILCCIFYCQVPTILTLLPGRSRYSIFFLYLRNTKNICRQSKQHNKIVSLYFYFHSKLSSVFKTDLFFPFNISKMLTVEEVICSLCNIKHFFANIKGH